MKVFFKTFFYLAKFPTDAENKGFLLSAELDILNLEIPRWLGGNDHCLQVTESLTWRLTLPV